MVGDSQLRASRWRMPGGGACTDSSSRAHTSRSGAGSTSGRIRPRQASQRIRCASTELPRAAPASPRTYRPSSSSSACQPAAGVEVVMSVLPPRRREVLTQSCLRPVQPGLHRVLRDAEQPRGLPAGQAVEHRRLDDGAHLGESRPSAAPRSPYSTPSSTFSSALTSSGGASWSSPSPTAPQHLAMPAQPRHEPTYGDAPEPGRDLSVPAPLPSLRPRGLEAVLQCVRDDVRVTAAAAQPGREPGCVPVVELAQGAEVPVRKCPDQRRVIPRTSGTPHIPTVALEPRRVPVSGDALLG